MKVKVWNDNTYDYEEKFREQDIKIPAKSFIEMEYDEALTFKGTFAGIKRDADNQPLPQFFKMIRLEPASPDMGAAKPEPLLCNSCRYLAISAKDLETHLKKHADDVVVDEAAEAATRQTRSKKAS
jgi:hypothetical protein